MGQKLFDVWPERTYAVTETTPFACFFQFVTDGGKGEKKNERRRRTSGGY